MKVVSNLTRLQFVRAQRGPGGGIRLNRLPKDIGLQEVIGNTEKFLNTLEPEPVSVNDVLTADARLNIYLHDALKAYLDELGRFTLADVLESSIDSESIIKIGEQAA